MRRRLLLDLRHAFRMLRRNPGFTAVATLVLAVGIGVNTASFGLLDALFLKPLPVHAPDELVRVAASAVDGAVSYPDLLDYRQAASLSGVAAFTADALTLREPGHEQGEPVAAYLVSDDYFDVLGVKAAIGRGLGVTAGGEPPGLVLSHAFWERRFGGHSGVLGRTLLLDGTTFVIAGVAPPAFTGTMRGGAPQVFVPFSALMPRETLTVRNRRMFIAIGRLAPGASVATAQAEVGAIARRLAAMHPDTNQRVSVGVGPESTALFRDAPQLAYVVAAVLGTFGLLLVMACVNLAALLTARATFRQREIAIRAAQGAPRGAIAAQLFTESLVLSLLGGLGGLLVGVVARNLLWRRLQSGVAAQLGLEALSIDTAVDARVLLFAIAATAGSALLFGLLPALQASKPDLYQRGKEDVVSPSPGHLASLRRLVAAQVTVSVVLLACAGLLLQIVRNATAMDLGYPLDHVYLADVEATGLAGVQADAALAVLLDRVRALPGIEAAALTAAGGPGYLPASMTPGRPQQNYVLSRCGPGYFAALRIPVLAGREFDPRDAPGSAPVAIVNARLAEALWPGQQAVGRALKVWDDRPPLTVVGVAKTVRSLPIGPPFYQLYVPLAQDPGARATLHVRVAPGQESSLYARLSDEVRRADAALTLVRVRPLAEWVDSVLSVPRALVTALASLGGAALFLAAVGLYGVTAYVAGRRGRECAIRHVLGATRLSVLLLLVRGAMATVLVGLVVGFASSLAVGWLLKSVLLGAAFDPVALAMAPAALVATALVSVILPASRAISLDPTVVLRDE